MAGIFPNPVIPRARSLRTGSITVGTIAVRGDDVKAAPDRAIAIVADSGNTGTVYVGYDANVTPTTGFPMTANTVLLLNVDNLNNVWFIADAAGQTIRYIVEVLA